MSTILDVAKLAGVSTATVEHHRLDHSNHQQPRLRRINQWGTGLCESEKDPGHFGKHLLQQRTGEEPCSNAEGKTGRRPDQLMLDSSLIIRESTTREPG